MSDALIWGASGGMGQALITKLADNGWRVFAAARDTSSIPTNVAEAYRFEAGDLHTIRDVALDLAHRTDGLDLWVYTAGDVQADFLRKLGLDAWTAVLNSNFNGAFLTISHTLNLINDDAQAVFIGAYIDHLIIPKMSAYAVAKAGLEPMVQILQREQRKINFTLVKPGSVATDFWQNVPFKMPASAKPPQVIAEAIYKQYQQGERGVLEL